MDNSSIALLIDWENIKFSASNHLGSPPDIITLKKIARKYGKISLARAYANWADNEHTGDMERLSQQNIEPVYVLTRKFADLNDKQKIKGSVDIRMACDAVELLTKNKAIATFVIISGDGGFIHILRKLKEYGKTVISVGIRETFSNELGIVADEVVLYNDWIKGLRVDASKGKVAEALKEFTSKVEDIRNRDGYKSYNNLQIVKELIKRKNPKFEEEEIGIPTFRHLAYLAEKQKSVKIDSTCEPACVYESIETVSDLGRKLYSSDEWGKLILAMKPNLEYAKADIMDILKKIVPEPESMEFFNLAMDSKILWSRKNSYFNNKENKIVETTKFLLNLNHPKVQVYK